MKNKLVQFWCIDFKVRCDWVFKQNINKIILTTSCTQEKRQVPGKLCFSFLFFIFCTLIFENKPWCLKIADLDKCGVYLVWALTNGGHFIQFPRFF